MSVTCRELLGIQALSRLEFELVGGDKGLDRAVNWVYFGDVIDDITDCVNWVNGNELVILTGNSIKGDIGDMLQILPKLCELRIAGVIISVGPYIPIIPDSLIRLSNDLALPLFRLPWKTKLVDVSRAICNAVIAGEIAERESANMLDALLFSSVQSPEQISAQLSRVDYDPEYSYRVGILNIANAERFKGERSGQGDIHQILMRKARGEFSVFAPTAFMVCRDSDLIFLAPSETGHSISKTISRIEESMRREFPGMLFNAGIGKAYKHPENFKKSFQQAKRALVEMTLEPDRPSPFYYKEDSIYSLLFGVDDQELLIGFHAGTLKPLLDYDRSSNSKLFLTLCSYINHNMKPQETSEALFIHKNTLKYRLAKVEEILSCDLKNPKTLANLCVAIGIHRLLNANVSLY